MADEAALGDLLSLWDRERAGGRNVSAAELCRDHPHLLPEVERQIALLRCMDRVAHPGDTAVEMGALDSSGQDTTGPYDSPATTGTAPDLRIPGYEVLGVLGRGGMGVVYKAKHLKFQRLVALKMILAGEHASPEDETRFLAEARAVARLSHPNIVQIHEIGEHEGRPYFSLEFVDGGNLAERLKGPPLSDKAAAKLVATLAEAMRHAHERGVIHRDLKPANVLLARDGAPKITDFGLAKSLGAGASQTISGAVLGTPSYMAPEQAGGRSSDVGPATDVYALGAILYELLTGRPPFHGETLMETLLQVQQEAPERPRAHNPRTDASLEAICLKCLAKDPQERYLSAEALADDLAADLRGEPVRAVGGTATRLMHSMFRETRHTEAMARWGRVLMGQGVVYFLVCLTKSVLLWSGVRAMWPYVTSWVLGLAAFCAQAWYCRFRKGPRLLPVERQVAHVWGIFWLGFFFTALVYFLHNPGGDVAVLFPVLLIEFGITWGCTAAILGGSFYVLAAACAVMALLEALLPNVGPILGGVIGGASLIWIGRKHSRHPHGK